MVTPYRTPPLPRSFEWLRHRRIARSFAVFLILYAVWSAALMEVIRVVK